MRTKVIFYTIFMILAIAIVISYPYMMVKPEESRHVLENSGYTNIVITGYAWFECDKSDVYQTGFTATAPNGRQVSGAVCRGIWKANTIRLDD